MGRIKYHIRQYKDGTIGTLRRLIGEGTDKVTLTMTRRFARLVPCYVWLYKTKGFTLLEAASWIKRHRSYRGYHAGTDKAMQFVEDPFVNALYYPLGKEHVYAKPTLAGLSYFNNGEDADFNVSDMDDDEDSDLSDSEDDDLDYSSDELSDGEDIGLFSDEEMERIMVE